MTNNKLPDGQLLFRLQEFYGAERDASKIGDHEYAQECADVVSIINEVQEYRKNDVIHRKEALKKGAPLISQFQVGDYLVVNPDSTTGLGDSAIKGWVVGVTFTSSKVYYDVAEDCGSDVCRIYRRLRCSMRRESDGAENEFINRSDATEALKSLLLDDSEETTDTTFSSTHLLH